VLDGFGLEDTHETLNSFIWGPDGWLYGCHGVFTHSRVGKPGTPKEKRVPLNAGIWRYHPIKDKFEVFAHGTSNPWGVDFNDHGARLNLDRLTPKGSGYVGDGEPDFLKANDLWSQILYLRYGPDGQVYMIDWYDRNQCHHGNPAMHDRTNGRIFKISYGNPKH